MKYKVNEQGVEALRTMAGKLEQAIEEINSLSQQIRSEADSNQETLGPHISSLQDVLDTVKESVNKAAEPAEGISSKLNSIAGKYEDIIANDPFSGAGN